VLVGITARLRLLCEAQRPALAVRYPRYWVDEFGCASWVPRYDIPVIGSNEASSFIAMRNASGSMMPCLNHDISMPDVLQVKGCVLGTVEETCSVMDGSRDVDDQILEKEIAEERAFTMRLTEVVLPLCAARYNEMWRTAFSGKRSLGTKEDISMLARSLTLGRYNDFKPPDAQTTADCAAFLLECKRFDFAPIGLPSDECLTESGAHKGDGKSFFTRLYFHARNRVPFTFDDGRLLGMGPLYMEKGDAVCIIYGCPLPLILHPEGRFWRLLGDAYVDGVMDVRSLPFQPLADNCLDPGRAYRQTSKR